MNSVDSNLPVMICICLSVALSFIWTPVYVVYTGQHVVSNLCCCSEPLRTHLRPSTVVDAIFGIKLCNGDEAIGGHLHKSALSFCHKRCSSFCSGRKGIKIYPELAPHKYLKDVLLSIANDSKVLSSSYCHSIIKWGELD